MYFESLHLKAFGGFTDRQLDLSAGPNRFHIVYGANESGKSTTLRAVTSLLYGFATKTDDDYVHPMANLRVGATLVDAETGRRLEVVRRKGTRRTLLDVDESEEIPEQAIVDMMGGVAKEDFTTRFGLSHDELVAGGQAILKGKGDLGEILFAAGAGIGRLRQIQEEIAGDSGELFKPRASNPTINRAINDLAAKRKEMRDRQVPTARYKALRSDLAAAKDEAAAAEKDVAAAATLLQRLEAIAKAIPLLPLWRSILDEDRQSAGVVLLDEQFTRRRREAAEQLAVTTERTRDLQTRIDAAQAKCDEHPVDEKVLAVASEIQSLFSEKSAIEKGVIDRDHLLSHRRRGLRNLRKSLAELSIRIDAEDDDDAIEQMSDAIDSVNISESNRRRIIAMAGQRGEPVAKRTRAVSDIETIESEIAALTERIDAADDPAPMAPLAETLSEVLSTIGNAAELLSHHESLVAAADEATAVCRTRFSKLVGFGGTMREAETLTLPHPAETERIERQWTETALRIDNHRAAIDKTKKQRRDAVSRRGEMDVRGELPSEEDLRSARVHRDATVAGTDAETYENRRGDIVEAIEHCDDVVDALRRHREQVLKIEQLDAEVRRIDQTIAEIETAMDIDADHLDAARSAWETLWTSIGVQPGPPEAMRDWAADHRRLVEAMQTRQTAEDRMRRSEQKLRHRIEQLTDALREDGSQIAIDDLPQWVHRGAAKLKQIEDATRQSAVWAEDHRRLLQTAEAARREADEAEREIADWQSQWSMLTSAIGDDQTDPTEVVERLNRITELVAMRKDTQLLFTRMRSMTDDETKFVRRVSRIAEAAGADATPGDFDAAMVTLGGLHERLQSHRRHDQTRSECQSQIQQLQTELNEAKGKRRQHELTLSTLAAEAGADDPESLPQLERDSAARREVLSRRAALHQQLLILAGDQDVESFARSIDDRDITEVELEIERCRTQNDAARQTLSQINQRVGALRHEMDQMDGSAGGSAMSQEIQMIAGQIGQDVRQYVLQRTQLLLLRRAIEHYRSQNQSPVLRLARAAFETLTAGRYSSLRTDYDAKGRTILTAVPADGGGEVAAHLLSTGTADALYLSLRLASLQHQIEHATPLPLIVDDCLVQLDDDRSAAAMRCFSELSTQTQVVLFTHHEHLVDLARSTLGDGGVHCHRLDAVGGG